MCVWVWWVCAHEHTLGPFECSLISVLPPAQPWLLIDYRVLQRHYILVVDDAFTKIQTFCFTLLCEQMHLAYKVPCQAADTYCIWLIGVHVVLSCHKPPALSLQLLGDLRAVILPFLCRNIIPFSLNSSPWFLMLVSFSCSTGGEAEQARGCCGCKESPTDVTIRIF